MLTGIENYVKLPNFFELLKKVLAEFAEFGNLVTDNGKGFIKPVVSIYHLIRASGKGNSRYLVCVVYLIQRRIT